MKKIISCIVSACLTAVLCLLLPEETYSQTHATEADSAAVSPDPGGGLSSAHVKGVTPMRARALAGGALGLASLVIGWRARKRAAAGIGNKGKNGAIVSLCLGAVALVLSLVHLAITGGAVFGSGSGKAGAIVAIVLSLAGMSLSGLVLRRKRG